MDHPLRIRPSGFNPPDRGHQLGGNAGAGFRRPDSLPAQQPGPIGLSWITQGRFQAGQVQSGSRVLVYAGAITTPFMEDTLTFQFTLDGTLMRHAVPVSYHFEMDED